MSTHGLFLETEPEALYLGSSRNEGLFKKDPKRGPSGTTNVKQNLKPCIWVVLEMRVSLKRTLNGALVELPMFLKTPRLGSY